VQAQLSSDAALSQLNLGAIARIPDEQGRAEPRGDGFELRTDAHGVIRAAEGLLLTTEGRDQAQRHVKSLDEARARLQTAQESHAALADLANRHAAQEGTQDEVARTLDSQVQEIAGQGSADPEARQFPEFERPHLAVDSPAGIAVSAAETLQLASRGDTAITTQGQLSVASQGGLFASVAKGIRMFAHKLGMRLVAGENDISMQALQASINFAAALRIDEEADCIVIEGRDEVVINGGGSGTIWNQSGITEFTAGQHVVHSAGRSYVRPASEPISTPQFPQGVCVECMLKAMDSGSPFPIPKAG
jgi:type VI secretion system secreted protein VgrG